MIIKIIGLSLLALVMFGIGYICGTIIKGLEAELDSREKDHKMQKVKEIMCDHYCGKPSQAITQDELDDICSGCPLNNI